MSTLDQWADGLDPEDRRRFLSRISHWLKSFTIDAYLKEASLPTEDQRRLDEFVALTQSARAALAQRQTDLAYLDRIGAFKSPHERAVWCVASEGFDREEYCLELDRRNVHLPSDWIKHDFAPKTYYDAWKQEELRSKIRAERKRILKRGKYHLARRRAHDF